jgi:hypothetical protein
MDPHIDSDNDDYDSYTIINPPAYNDDEYDY